MRQYPCERCPLRGNDCFREFTKEELEFVSRFKTGELVVEAGGTILSQGASSAYIYTILSGWGFRYKDLDDGRRQILNYVFPGELIGLQAAVLDEMEHTVEALTDVLLCVFERKRMWDLYKQHPSLGFDVTWLAAREEQILEDHLLTLGRRTAKERTAYLIMYIFERARRVGLNAGDKLELPLTQQHVADTLGLSLVHTNKTLKKLYDDKLVAWKKKTLEVLDYDGLKETSSWEGLSDEVRPLI